MAPVPVPVSVPDGNTRHIRLMINASESLHVR